LAANIYVVANGRSYKIMAPHPSSNLSNKPMAHWQCRIDWQAIQNSPTLFGKFLRTDRQ
jgi:hypothetical protein